MWAGKTKRWWKETQGGKHELIFFFLIADIIVQLHGNENASFQREENATERKNY